MSIAFQIFLKTMKVARFKIGFGISEIGGGKIF
jgi:hypothetical protein